MVEVRTRWEYHNNDILVEWYSRTLEIAGGLAIPREEILNLGVSERDILFAARETFGRVLDELERYGMPPVCTLQGLRGLSSLSTSNSRQERLHIFSQRERRLTHNFYELLRQLSYLHRNVSRQIYHTEDSFYASHPDGTNAISTDGLSWVEQTISWMETTWSQPFQSSKNAAEKAEKLLLRFLTPEQRKTYSDHKTFDVVATNGRKYKIWNSRVYNIQDLSGGKVRYCGGPDNVPMGDFLLAQKLHLESDAKSFLSKCNRDRRSEGITGMGFDIGIIDDLVRI